MSAEAKEAVKPSQLHMENESLRQRVSELEARLAMSEHQSSQMLSTVPSSSHEAEEKEISRKALSIVVVGASGDLAWKKTFPALFSLYCHGLLPEDVIIAGYARSKQYLDKKLFSERISPKFNKKFADKVQPFLDRCFYFAGQYDSADDFKSLDVQLREHEKAAVSNGKANRIFYFAIPPTLFVAVGKGVQPAAISTTGWNRMIVEKPFGHDSESSAELGNQLAALFEENQLYRIDHYLGKEMVQNLMVLRFANSVFEPLWCRQHISMVQITFKEDFGTKGRGGYFDKFGIIRDVMQNHLLQILSLVAMEAPVTLGAEDVRDEKVKLLRAIPPISMEDVVIGQYDADPNGSESSYLDDPTVPNDSITPTFATAVLHINNSRWKDVPFVLKCGKALNERKAEIRIQFQKPHNDLFESTSSNELVIRVQPREAMYLKMSTKKPGLLGGIFHGELDMTYNERFDEHELSLPDAYERLIHDVVRGDHNLFVRSDELVAAWKIFTPLLHTLDDQKVKPVIYPYNSRGPKESDELVNKYGYKRTTDYKWRGGSMSK